jgi:hypothetical protein
MSAPDAAFVAFLEAIAAVVPFLEAIAADLPSFGERDNVRGEYPGCTFMEFLIKFSGETSWIEYLCRAFAQFVASLEGRRVRVLDLLAFLERGGAPGGRARARRAARGGALDRLAARLLAAVWRGAGPHERRALEGLAALAAGEGLGALPRTARALCSPALQAEIEAAAVAEAAAAARAAAGADAAAAAAAARVAEAVEAAEAAEADAAAAAAAQAAEDAEARRAARQAADDATIAWLVQQGFGLPPAGRATATPPPGPGFGAGSAEDETLALALQLEGDDASRALALQLEGDDASRALALQLERATLVAAARSVGPPLADPGVTGLMQRVGLEALVRSGTVYDLEVPGGAGGIHLGPRFQVELHTPLGAGRVPIGGSFVHPATGVTHTGACLYLTVSAATGRSPSALKDAVAARVPDLAPSGAMGDSRALAWLAELFKLAIAVQTVESPLVQVFWPQEGDPTRAVGVYHDGGHHQGHLGME